jgi:hypothetical protein
MQFRLTDGRLPTIRHEDVSLVPLGRQGARPVQATQIDTAVARAAGKPGVVAETAQLQSSRIS